MLGVRCWKDRIALVALSGDPGDEPDLVVHRRVKLPAIELWPDDRPDAPPDAHVIFDL